MVVSKKKKKKKLFAILRHFMVENGFWHEKLYPRARPNGNLAKFNLPMASLLNAITFVAIGVRLAWGCSLAQLYDFVKL